MGDPEVPKACEHNIPETKKGAGPCQIGFEVLKRSGQPNWWCHTHGMEASGPDGSALTACPGSWFDPVPEEQRLTLDISDGQVAIWGAVPPPLTFGPVSVDPGKVHVHHRASARSEKDIDRSFDIVTLTNADKSFVVEGMAAVAFSISELTSQIVVPLTCPRCGQGHIDEQKFATRPHRKHLCNSCGRNFNDGAGPSISNPLAQIRSALGVANSQAPHRSELKLEINRADFSAIAIWPSNLAILSTMTRPEEFGIHVHGWQGEEMAIDETFGAVVLDGEAIDQTQLRWLAAFGALAHGAPIAAEACGSCGRSLLSPVEGWIEPLTSHRCGCGVISRTRKKVFLNPLAAKLQH
jgi:transposase-like protein